MHIDHVGISVPKASFQKVLDFYKAALAPLGYKVLMQPFETAAGLGKEGAHADFWITGRDAEAEPALPVHFAFSATDRKAVDGFHEAALASGGKDNGAPGVREFYHPAYYASFVIDPLGNNVELVCHAPPS